MKSVERVRDLGEVFTPDKIVGAMLDLLPDEMWQPHPSRTFFEPAAGDGNFLVAILARKLDAVEAAWRSSNLPAGNSTAALELHSLQALSSIYGVDISAENVIGGVPGHDIGARDRLLTLFTAWFESMTASRITDRRSLFGSAVWVVEHNVMVGNMLPLNADGTYSGHGELPLIEYCWDATGGRVSLVPTTLGQVEAEARSRTNGPPSLFDSLLLEPVSVWTGRPSDLQDAPIPAPSFYRGPVRNGRRRGGAC